MSRNTVFLGIFCLLVVSSGSCASEDPSVAGTTPSILDWPVDEAGPYRTGYRTMPYTYTAQATGEDRTIDVHVWYPTEATTGEHPTYEVIFEDPISLLNAPLAPSPNSDGYPVHVYSHGNMGFGGASPFLMRHFASHGWVVVAPDHTGNTLSDNINPRPPQTYLNRATDVSAVLDWLETLPESDPLHKKTLTEQAILSGHSFGAHTCWASAGATFDMGQVTADCSSATGSFSGGPCTETELNAFGAGVGDSRIAGIIPMAGSISRGLFGSTGHETVTIPILAMSGSEDPVGADSQFATCDGLDITWVDIEGGCHQAFALGFCENITDEKVFSIIETYALAFGRRHVLGDTSDSIIQRLDGSILVADEVELQHK